MLCIFRNFTISSIYRIIYLCSILYRAFSLFNFHKHLPNNEYAHWNSLSHQIIISFLLLPNLRLSLHISPLSIFLHFLTPCNAPVNHTCQSFRDGPIGSSASPTDSAFTEEGEPDSSSPNHDRSKKKKVLRRRSRALYFVSSSFVLGPIVSAVLPLTWISCPYHLFTFPLGKGHYLLDMTSRERDSLIP